MKILVTGIEGYISSLLTPVLLQCKHEVVGLDLSFNKLKKFYEDPQLNLKILRKDIQHITIEDLYGVDAVVHMIEQCPTITPKIHYQTSMQLANIAKAAGVSRFVYLSSCSLYGITTTNYVTEDSPVNPQTAYAICKAQIERDIKAIADDTFSPTYLRKATTFGASPRMRFDTMLNNLAGLAWTTKEINITNNGGSWCSLVHVLDICKAIVCTLEAPRDIVHNQVFNVGDTVNNYQVREVADIVAEVFKVYQLKFENNSVNQKYRVCFEKINYLLPGFKCEWNVQRGTQQLLSFFNLVDAPKTNFLFVSISGYKG